MPAAMTPEQRRMTETVYMALCIWREARNEKWEGKVAVGFTILNRVSKPKWWGRTVVGVITAPWQYSSMTDPKDVQLTKWGGDDLAWPECIAAAQAVYDGKIENPVPTADSYYATWMDRQKKTPKWATAKTTRYIAQIGGHKFFDTDGEHPENVKA